MANYTIIGGDGKEYGPVTAADLRQWIAEERLNAQSLAKAESDAEFRPLEKFPEFADAFGKAPTSGVPPIQPQPAGTVDNGRAAALERIKVPALGLKITAVINAILSVWGLISLFFSKADAQEMQELNQKLEQLNNPQLMQFTQKMVALFSSVPLGIANTVFGLAMAALIFLGASKMQSLRSYQFAFTAAVLSVVPCLTPCCGYVIGLVFGIWALWLLTRPEIKSTFT
jgi:hypothetical protein